MGRQTNKAIQIVTLFMVLAMINKKVHAYILVLCYYGGIRKAMRKIFIMIQWVTFWISSRRRARCWVTPIRSRMRNRDRTSGKATTENRTSWTETIVTLFMVLAMIRDCVQRSLQGGGEGVFWICNHLQRGGRGGFGFATTTLSFYATKPSIRSYWLGSSGIVNFIIE